MGLLNSLLLLTSILTTLSLLYPSLHQSIEVHPICSGINFTANSTYQSNLRHLLSSLASSTVPSGFNTSATGSPPDRVEALALCRGDVSSSSCSTCLDAATSDAEKNCPHAKSARIYYNDCQLLYSHRHFLSVVDTDTKCFWNATKVSSSENARFNLSVRAMLAELRSYAVHNATSPPLFAAGEMELGGGAYGKIHGMVQCTRDISTDECDQCLDKIIKDLFWCYGWRVGTSALAGSCSWRYETYEFFNWPQRVKIPALTAEELGISELPPSPPADSNGTPRESSGSNDKTVTVLAIVIPVGVVAFVLVLIGRIHLSRKKETSIRSGDDEEKQGISMAELLLFDLNLIKRATNDFCSSNKLGEGGFGPVYKGKLPDDRDIAVKRLSSSSNQGIEELKNEVLLLAKLKHKNLVGLLGACVEGGEKLLIYEFVVNKSLDIYLSDPIKRLLLNWEKRCKIIAGVARGLLYLHEESQLKIVHRDLKASNILLDGEMNPKISDFGLARLFGRDQTQACTKKVIGTFGYMSPEYVMRGRYSTKSDIYSFGVLALEIVTGRRNCDSLKTEGLLDLLSYVWEHWSRGSATTIVDSSMDGNYPQSEALRFIQIGLLCVQDNPTDRPTMSSVVLMLSSESVSIRSPLPISSDFSVANSLVYSPNEVSISDFEPR